MWLVKKNGTQTSRMFWTGSRFCYWSRAKEYSTIEAAQEAISQFPIRQRRNLEVVPANPNSGLGWKSVG